MKYEKPALRFMSYETKEPVANTCWGFHGTGTDLFVDVAGGGYASFQIGGRNCNLYVVNVKYYPHHGCESPEPATAEQIKEIEDILVASGGNSGNPYKGEGEVVFPGTADPHWS